MALRYFNLLTCRTPGREGPSSPQALRPLRTLRAAPRGFVAILILVPLSLLSAAEGVSPAPTPAVPAPANTTSPTTAPAKNWVLPLFSKEGYRTMTLRGTEVRPVSSARIDVIDMSIAVFSGDVSARVDSVLLSPAASFFPGDKIARGPGSVRLIRDDVVVTGEQWVYDQVRKKVSLAKNTRVILSAQLNDILK